MNTLFRFVLFLIICILILYLISKNNHIDEILELQNLDPICDNEIFDES